MNREAFVSQQEEILNDKRDRYTQRALHLPAGEINPHTLGKLTLSFPFIEQALTKIREGTYGTCEDCGEPIPEARLRAVPGAIRCICCQEQEDRTHARR